MTPKEFCYWLQGYFEINEPDAALDDLTKEQTEIIKSHLKLVFTNVTNQEQLQLPPAPAPLSPLLPPSPFGGGVYC